MLRAEKFLQLQTNSRVFRITCPQSLLQVQCSYLVQTLNRHFSTQSQIPCSWYKQSDTFQINPHAACWWYWRRWPLL